MAVVAGTGWVVVETGSAGVASTELGVVGMGKVLASHWCLGTEQTVVLDKYYMAVIGTRGTVGVG